MARWVYRSFFIILLTSLVNGSSTQGSESVVIGQFNAFIMGESALVDKETGRVIWEGGRSSSLSTSVNPYLTSRGLKHVKAAILTSVLFLALLGAIASAIRNALEQSTSENRSLPAAITLFLAKWTILKVPKVDTGLLIAVIALYLLESHSCSTRRYLSNALSSPAGVEDYIEKMRSHSPMVTWKVRSFHYEMRKWLYPILYLVQRIQRHRGADVPGVLRKKVITNVATGNYTYASFQDNTVAGVWKRAMDTSARSAPFAKISISKLVILSNKKARQDYFKQQAAFLTQEGQGDEFAEFSTNIQVDGFKPRMLAVRDVQGVPSAKLFRIQLFWFFTLLGLTVPFRIWFATHCDELRLTVVKETSTDKPSSWSTKGWFSRSVEENTAASFKQRMQKLSLYENEYNASTTAAEAQMLLEDIEAVKMAEKLEQLNGTKEENIENMSNNSTTIKGTKTDKQ